MARREGLRYLTPWMSMNTTIEAAIAQNRIPSIQHTARPTRSERRQVELDSMACVRGRGGAWAAHPASDSATAETSSTEAIANRVCLSGGELRPSTFWMTVGASAREGSKKKIAPSKGLGAKA